MASSYNQKEFQRDLFIQSQVNSRRNTYTEFKLASFYYYWVFTSSRLLDPSSKVTHFSQESENLNWLVGISGKVRIKVKEMTERCYQWR